MTRNSFRPDKLNRHTVHADPDELARNDVNAELALPSLENAGQTAEPEMPPLSEEDQASLAELSKRHQVLHDLTIGCVRGHHTGAYVAGPPGGGKSHTIHSTLRDLKVPWRLHQRITAKPLYLELEKHPGAVHVVDDCEQILSEKSALTLLRSALGGERVGGHRERKVSYSVAGSRARVLSHYFFGAIIFTSNRPLTDEKPEIRALMSRIPSLWFSPPEDEMRALMRHVARQEHMSETGRMASNECVEVIEYVIRTAAELECRLDLRWIDHAYGHYLTHVASGGTIDWRDMVRFHVMNTMTHFNHTPQPQPGQATPDDDLDREVATARQIAQTPGLSREERVRRWEERTGLSRATYYRRLGSAGSSS